MIQTDGGNANGVKIEQQQGKLSLFDATKQGKVDATWVFLPWEGVEAELEGVKLHAFRPGDFSIPYGYSPVIARNAASSKLNDDTLWNFVAATMEGYRTALENPDAAVEALSEYCDPPRSKDFLRKSQEAINEYYRDGSTLGRMSSQRWRAFVDWLKGRGLLEGVEIDADKLFKQP